MKTDERWMIKDDDFKGFWWQMEGLTDICECSVAYATEKVK